MINNSSPNISQSQRDKDNFQNQFSRHEGLLKEGQTNGSIMAFTPNQCKVSAINLSTPKCSNTTSPFNLQPVIMKQVTYYTSYSMCFRDAAFHVSMPAFLSQTRKKTKVNKPKLNVMGVGGKRWCLRFHL